MWSSFDHLAACLHLWPQNAFQPFHSPNSSPIFVPLPTFHYSADFCSLLAPNADEVCPAWHKCLYVKLGIWDAADILGACTWKDPSRLCDLVLRLVLESPYLLVLDNFNLLLGKFKYSLQIHGLSLYLPPSQIKIQLLNSWKHYKSDFVIFKLLFKLISATSLGILIIILIWLPFILWMLWHNLIRM